MSFSCYFKVNIFYSKLSSSLSNDWFENTKQRHGSQESPYLHPPPPQRVPVATRSQGPVRVATLPCSPGPCDQLTFGQEDLGCCLFSSQTIQKEKIDKINKHVLK